MRVPPAHPSPATDGLDPDSLTSDGLFAPGYLTLPEVPGTPSGRLSDLPDAPGRQPEAGRPGDPRDRPAPGDEGLEAPGRPSGPPPTAEERPDHGDTARPDRPGAQEREGKRRGERPRRTDESDRQEGEAPPSGNRPAPRPSDQAIGKHDLYEPDTARPDEDRAGDRMASHPSGQVLPVLPLGAGMTLIGLGLAFLALRLRRG